MSKSWNELYSVTDGLVNACSSANTKSTYTGKHYFTELGATEK